uniref:Uncharacterized protein n=1 Tax=Trichogramma kaykai TaxID=54128 RepID=A0ABD2VU05_9HYME
MCNVRFDRVLFYYGAWQESYRTDFQTIVPIIEFREGLPAPEDYSNDNERRKLLILDDLMRESSNADVLDLFTKGSHHKNLSIIFITQNVFHQGAKQRDLSLNTKYMVLFKNPRDKSQIRHLAQQVFPEDPKFHKRRTPTRRVFPTLICFSISRSPRETS